MKTSALFALALAAAAKKDEPSAADTFHANAEESSMQDALSSPFSCYSGESDGYIGLASTTATGQQCQNWLDSHPVDIGSDRPMGDFPMDNNYCRQMASGEQPKCWGLGSTKEDGPQLCEVAKCPPDDTVANMKAARDELIVALGEPDGADTDEKQNCKCADALFGSTTSMSDTSVGLIQTRMGTLRDDGSCDCSEL